MSGYDYAPDYDQYLADSLDAYDRQRAVEIPESWIQEQEELREMRAAYIKQSLIEVDETAKMIAMSAIANMAGEILLSYPEVKTISLSVFNSNSHRNFGLVTDATYMFEGYGKDKTVEFHHFVKKLFAKFEEDHENVGLEHLTLFQESTVDLYRAATWNLADGLDLFHEFTHNKYPSLKK